jgi:hypothetical protein
MPVKSHIRWVQDQFLSIPEVQTLAPLARIKRQTLLLTSASFTDGIGMMFNQDSACVCLHKQGQLVDIFEFPDMAPVRVGRHQFKCIFCDLNGGRERFSSARAMYLDHCITPMLELVRKGAYFR